MEDRIQQWHPFRFIFTDLCGHRAMYTFTCPRCHGHNCEKLGDLDKDVFLSGYFRCSDCGETHENGESLCCYSDAFIYKRFFTPVEQTLF